MSETISKPVQEQQDKQQKEERAKKVVLISGLNAFSNGKQFNDKLVNAMLDSVILSNEEINEVKKDLQKILDDSKKKETDKSKLASTFLQKLRVMEIVNDIPNKIQTIKNQYGFYSYEMAEYIKKTFDDKKIDEEVILKFCDKFKDQIEVLSRSKEKPMEISPMPEEHITETSSTLEKQQTETLPMTPKECRMFVHCMSAGLENVGLFPEHFLELGNESAEVTRNENESDFEFVKRSSLAIIDTNKLTMFALNLKDGYVGTFCKQQTLDQITPIIQGQIDYIFKQGENIKLSLEDKKRVCNEIAEDIINSFNNVNVQGVAQSSDGLDIDLKDKQQILSEYVELSYEKAQKMELQKQLEALGKKLDETTQEKDQLVKENSNMRNSVIALQGVVQRTPDNTKSVGDLKLSVSDLEVSDGTSSAGTSNDIISDTIDLMQSQSSKIADQQQQLEAQQQEIEKLRAANAGQADQLEAAQTRVSELEAANENQANKLQEAQTTIKNQADQLAAEQEEKQRQAETISNLKTANEGQAETITKQKQENIDQQKQISQLTGENDTLNQQLRDAQTQLDEERNKNKEQTETIASQTNQLKKQDDALKQVQQENTEQAETIAKQKQENIDQQKQISQLTGENDTLNQQFRNAQAQFVAEQQKTEKLETTVKDQANLLKTVQDDKAAIQRQLDEEQKRRKQAETQLKGAQTTIANQTQQFNQLNIQFQALGQGIQQAMSEKAEAIRQNVTLGERNQQLQSQLERQENVHRQQIQQRDAVIERMQQQVTEAQNQIKNLQEEAMRQRIELTSANAKIAQSESLNATLQNSRDRSLERAQNARDANEELARENRFQREQIERLQKDLAAEQQEKDKLERTSTANQAMTQAVTKFLSTEGKTNKSINKLMDIIGNNIVNCDTDILEFCLDRLEGKIQLNDSFDNIRGKLNGANNIDDETKQAKLGALDGFKQKLESNRKTRARSSDEIDKAVEGYSKNPKAEEQLMESIQKHIDKCGIKRLETALKRLEGISGLGQDQYGKLIEGLNGIAAEKTIPEEKKKIVQEVVSGLKSKQEQKQKEKQLQNKEQQLEQVEQELAEVRDKLGLVQDDNARQAEKISELETTNKNQAETIAIQQKQLQDKEQEIKRQQDALTQAQEAKKQLQQQLADKQEEIGRLNTQLGDSNKQIDGLNDRINNINDEKSQLTEQGRKLEEQIKVLESTIEQTERDNEEALEKKQGEVDRLTNENSSKDTTLAQQEEDLKKLRSELDKNQQAQQQIETEKQKLLEEKTQWVQSEARLKEQLQQGNQQIKTLTEQNNAQSQKVDELQENIKSLNQQHAQEIDAVKAEVEAANAEQEKIYKQQAQQAQKDAKQREQQLHNQLQEQQRLTATAEERNQQLQKQNEEQKNAYQEEIEELKRQHQEKEKQLQETQANLAITNAVMNFLKENKQTDEVVKDLVDVIGKNIDNCSFNTLTSCLDKLDGKIQLADRFNKIVKNLNKTNKVADNNILRSDKIKAIKEFNKKLQKSIQERKEQKQSRSEFQKNLDDKFIKANRQIEDAVIKYCQYYENPNQNQKQENLKAEEQLITSIQENINDCGSEKLQSTLETLKNVSGLRQNQYDKLIEGLNGITIKETDSQEKARVELKKETIKEVVLSLGNTQRAEQLQKEKQQNQQLQEQLQREQYRKVAAQAAEKANRKEINELNQTHQQQLAEKQGEIDSRDAEIAGQKTEIEQLRAQVEQLQRERDANAEAKNQLQEQNRIQQKGLNDSASLQLYLNSQIKGLYESLTTENRKREQLKKEHKQQLQQKEQERQQQEIKANHEYNELLFAKVAAEQAYQQQVEQLQEFGAKSEEEIMKLKVEKEAQAQEIEKQQKQISGLRNKYAELKENYENKEEVQNQALKSFFENIDEAQEQAAKTIKLKVGKAEFDVELNNKDLADSFNTIFGDKPVEVANIFEKANEYVDGLEKEENQKGLDALYGVLNGLSGKNDSLKKAIQDDGKTLEAFKKLNDNLKNKNETRYNEFRIAALQQLTVVGEMQKAMEFANILGMELVKDNTVDKGVETENVQTKKSGTQIENGIQSEDEVKVSTLNAVKVQRNKKIVEKDIKSEDRPMEQPTPTASQADQAAILDMKADRVVSDKNKGNQQDSTEQEPNNLQQTLKQALNNASNSLTTSENNNSVKKSETFVYYKCIQKKEGKKEDIGLKTELGKGDIEGVTFPIELQIESKKATLGEVVAYAKDVLESIGQEVNSDNVMKMLDLQGQGIGKDQLENAKKLIANEIKKFASEGVGLTEEKLKEEADKNQDYQKVLKSVEAKASTFIKNNDKINRTAKGMKERVEERMAARQQGIQLGGH